MAKIRGNNRNNRLRGTKRKDTILGLGGNDVLQGLGGDDLLTGGPGRDRLEGGQGNDTYIVDGNDDRVIERGGQGTDTVRASVNFVLGANLENLTLTGNGNLRGTGNELSNIIIGNNGNNVLDGGAGDDKIGRASCRERV